jgi:hypothetical protein
MTSYGSSPRLEPLTVTQEAEAVELLTALLAASARRRRIVSPLTKAA